MARTKGAKNKKTSIEYPIQVNGCNATTKNAWLKTQSGKSRKNAIRAMCLLCVGGATKEVVDCSASWCPLFQFRLTG